MIKLLHNMKKNHFLVAMFPATLKARFLGLLEAGMDKIPRANLLSLGYCVLISDKLQNWIIPNSLLSLQWLATVSSNTFCLYICTSSSQELYLMNHFTNAQIHQL